MDQYRYVAAGPAANAGTGRHEQGTGRHEQQHGHKYQHTKATGVDDGRWHGSTRAVARVGCGGGARVGDVGGRRSTSR